MKIIEILPELDIGGVERHVIDLANELTARGHEVIVISAGGKMQSQLSERVRHIDMPVHKKNPFTIWSCSRKIAELARCEGVRIIHAHSRVPAWIALLVSKRIAIPFVVTAHSNFTTKARFIYLPYRKASQTICVSRTVQDGMKECFYDNTIVIHNGLSSLNVKRNACGSQDVLHFLFVGRLVEYKGVQDILNAMPQSDKRWVFDIVGDGPYCDQLRQLAASRGIDKQVVFHGYSDCIDDFLSTTSCALFPSHDEGFGLVLGRAIQMGTPVIATNIEATRELIGTSDGLIEPGDIDGWNIAIKQFMTTRYSKITNMKIHVTTISDMVNEIEKVYNNVVKNFGIKEQL